MLEVDDVTFLYAPGRGIAHASLKVAPGEVVGIVGGNGAGKSTLLGLVSAAMLPQQGVISLALSDLSGRTRRYRSDQGIGYRRHVGYLSELAPLYDEMSVARYLRFRAKLKGERFLRIRRRVNEALVRCGLESLRRANIGRLSLGQRRRVALAEAILTLPEVLILDDPFAGLDATLRANIGEVLRDVAIRSHVLVSGHDPILLKSCCTRFAVVEKGHIVADHLSATDAMKRLQPEEPAK